MKKERSLVLYPFLVAVFPPVSLFSRNVYEASPSGLIAPLLLTLVVAALLYSVATKAIGDAHRAGLIVTLFFVLFFTVSRITEDLNRALPRLIGGGVQLAAPLVVSAELILIAFLMYGALVRIRSARALTPALNAFAVALIALPTIPVVIAFAREGGGTDEHGTILVDTPTPAKRPDVYYIICDALGRDDIVSDTYGYDLGPFLGELERRGFYVPRSSTSNYGHTRLSLSSSLNARYLNGLRPDTYSFQSPLVSLIQDSSVAKTFRRHGYRTVAFATGYEVTEIKSADLFLKPFDSVSEFHLHLIHSTPLSALVRDPYSAFRERALFILDRLPELARHPEPTFTFAHIISPHPPFVFGPRGEDISRRDRAFSMHDANGFPGTADEYIHGYRSQIAFITSRLLVMIDGILKNSEAPPVIIIQGDHGPGLPAAGRSEELRLRERMSITNAYYLPGRGSGTLYEQITPVNSFRVVLNELFGSELALLEDRNYWASWKFPFKFDDVTELVRRDRTRVATGAPAPKT